MRKNNLQEAAKYALERMQDHESRNSVSLGFDCGISLLKDALAIPLEERDERNLYSIGIEQTKHESLVEAPAPSTIVSGEAKITLMFAINDDPHEELWREFLQKVGLEVILVGIPEGYPEATPLETATHLIVRDAPIVKLLELIRVAGAGRSIRIEPLRCGAIWITLIV